MKRLPWVGLSAAGSAGAAPFRLPPAFELGAQRSTGAVHAGLDGAGGDAVDPSRVFDRLAADDDVEVEPAALLGQGCDQGQCPVGGERGLLGRRHRDLDRLAGLRVVQRQVFVTPALAPGAPGEIAQDADRPGHGVLGRDAPGGAVDVQQRLLDEVLDEAFRVPAAGVAGQLLPKVRQQGEELVLGHGLSLCINDLFRRGCSALR